jgi:hypothetical protein
VLINKSQTRRKTVTVHLPAGARPAATVERLLAPSVRARHGVTLGGRGYGAPTASGQLGAPEIEPARVVGGRVTLSVPAASAALLTIG